MLLLCVWREWALSVVVFFLRGEKRTKERPHVKAYHLSLSHAVPSSWCCCSERNVVPRSVLCGEAFFSFHYSVLKRGGRERERRGEREERERRVLLSSIRQGSRVRAAEKKKKDGGEGFSPY